MRIRLTIFATAAFLLLAGSSRAACVNKFTQRTNGSLHAVTLLTGKLTFQSARELAAAIREGKTAPLEWVDPSGKRIAKQFGELKVVRPMPVACDDNASGVIMIAVFPGAQPPQKKIFIKLDANKTVAFDEQVQ